MTVTGYAFRSSFLVRQIRFGDTALWKLSLFRHRLGRYEARLTEQDRSMADIEIHEHVIVDGKVGKLQTRLGTRISIRSVATFRSMTNTRIGRPAYSLMELATYEPRFWQSSRASAMGQEAPLLLPGFPVLIFLYTWILRGAFLDGNRV